MKQKNLLKAGLIYAALTILALGSLNFVRANATEAPAPNADGNTTASTESLPLVVTTTAHIADIVHNILKDHATVHALIGTGLDPHLYHPLRSDMLELERADLAIYNGMNLEGRMQERLHKMHETGKLVIALAERLALSGEDPHIWMDVRLWINATHSLIPDLIALAPQHEEEIKDNAQRYITALEQLDTDIKTMMATIPESNRTLITAHDAFGYFGKAYGLNVIGIQGLSTASEAGLKQIESLVTLCTTQKIPALFAETSVSDKNIRAIIEGARSKGHHMHIGGTLYSDSLGAGGTEQDNYIGMMRTNAQTIADALKGHHAIQ